MDLARDIQKAYQELDLTPGASLEEVKTAYRRLARALHPDLHPGTLGALMSRVNQAYDKLLKHLEGGAPHQAGPARPARQPHPQKASAARPQARREGRQYSAYQYEEFEAQREAHGEHARRFSAWQEAKRRFYRQAAQAAQAAARAAAESKASARAQEREAQARAAGPAPRWADETQVKSPGDPRVNPQPAVDLGEKPAPGPLSVNPGPHNGWRLLGLAQEDGVLVYRVELTGDPASLHLPVRCCRPCRQCEGSGRYSDQAGRLHRCPACGGRGRVTRADRVLVELPANWRPGQRVKAPACNPDHEIVVELNRA